MCTTKLKDDKDIAPFLKIAGVCALQMKDPNITKEQYKNRKKLLNSIYKELNEHN